MHSNPCMECPWFGVTNAISGNRDTYHSFLSVSFAYFYGGNGPGGPVLVEVAFFSFDRNGRMPSGARIKPTACATNRSSAGRVLLPPSYPPQDLGSAEPPGVAKRCDDPTPSAREMIPHNVLESAAEAVRLYGGDVS